MKKAKRADKQRVVDILTASFADDPHTNWLVGADEAGKEERLTALMNLAFEESLLHDKVYLSHDRTGAALWKKARPAGFSFAFLKSRLRFARVFGLEKTRNALAMKNLIKRYLPPRNYLCLWFIGVLPDSQGRGTASELLDPVLKDCVRRKLPVYLQTANPENVRLYQHKGFRIYHEWSPPDKSDLLIRFMEKSPGTAPKKK